MAAATNRQTLEGLWALGVSADLLGTISDTGRQRDFDKRLRDSGITREQINRARSIVEWRPSRGADPTQEAFELLGLWGVPQELMQGDPFAMAQSLLGPQAATQFAIKTGAPTGGAWNPFRDDQPPPPPPPPALTRPQIPRVPQVPGAGGGGGGTVTLPAPQGPPPPPDVTIDDADTLIQRTYGFSAFALDIPEVRSVLEQAAAGDWDDNRIIGAITNTAWWRQTTDKERQWTAFENQDPESARLRLQQTVEGVRAQARAAGFTVDEGRMAQIAQLSLRHGWDAGQVRRALASEFRFDPTGEKQAFAVNLKRLAGEYVVPMSDDTIERWGQQLLSGEATEDDFNVYLTEQAKSMYPGLTSALDRGLTVRQYADPYIQIAARTLEISDNDVNLAESKWLRALNQVDPKTGERTVMALSDWERTLKNDPQYGYDRTKGAREEAVALGTGLLRSFGAL